MDTYIAVSAWYWGRDDIGGPFLEQMPLGRWATEAEIAAPIVFLLSDAASMITGVTPAHRRRLFQPLI
jgi:L-xylulose reductase